MINFTPASYGEFNSEEGAFLLDNSLKSGFYVMIVTNDTDTETYLMNVKEGITNYSTVCGIADSTNSLWYTGALNLYAQTEFKEGSTIECIRLF